MYAIKEWLETDESAKDVEWAKIIVRNIRWYMQPLVDMSVAQRGMDYLFGSQDMTAIRNLFLNPQQILNNRPVQTYVLDQHGNRIPQTGSDVLLPEMEDVIFRPFQIFEKSRNIITAETKEMGILTTIQAVDPTSREEKRHDEAHLKNRRNFESLLSYVYQRQGEPPVKMSEYEARFGKTPTKGNVEEFDKMGLNADDPQDVRFFMDFFHKLKQEIALQQPVDALFKFNDSLSKYDLWVTDFMAKKAIASQVYVSDMNGAPTQEYVAPENVYIYGSTGRDKRFKDCNAIVVEKIVTVREFLNCIGDAFDFEKDWNVLIMSIFFTTNINITGIVPGISGNHVDAQFYGRQNGTGPLLNYSYKDFMNFRVSLGYVEWNSQNLEDNMNIVDVLPEKNENGGIIPKTIPDNKRYATKARFEQPTYKCWYLPISTIDQIIFKFGKLPYHGIKGYNDTASNFSILVWKEPGLPISLICQERVDLFNEMFYKFKYEVRVAKAKGRLWNIENLISVAEQVITDTSMALSDKVFKIMQMNAQSKNEIYGTIKVDGETKFIPGSQLNSEINNGIPESALIYLRGMAEQYQLILEEIGIGAPLRQGDPGGNRDSMHLQLTALDYSQKATYYIPDGISYITNATAERFLFYTQDIIQFGNTDTLAYRFMQDLVGELCLQDIGELGKTSARRYAIFVESTNAGKAKEQLNAILIESIKTKSITTAQLLLIQEIKNPKLAFATLAYLEQRNQKAAQQAQQAQAQQAHQNQMQLQQMQFQIEKMKGDYMLEAKKIDYDSTVQAHAITQQGGITKTLIKTKADADEIAVQAENDLKQIQQQSNINTPPPPPVPQPQEANTALAAGLAHQQNPNNQSVIRQQQQNAIMAPTSVGQSLS